MRDHLGYSKKIKSDNRICSNLHHTTIVSIITLVTILAGFYVFHDNNLFATAAVNNNQLSLPELFKLVNQSVVQISGTSDNANQQGFRLGSGFIYDNNGFIITNFHVVNGENEFLVTFSDGSIHTGRAIGADAFSDLAVINVSTVAKEKLKPLTIGNSSELVVGEQVAAVGNPFGLSGSMTEGIISALGRQLPSAEEPQLRTDFSLEPSFSIPDIIQTDAAINPGNSGGPLLNMKGEVVGINSAIFSNTGLYSGVGFAIPSDTIQKIVPSLIKNGSYDHPWLGITGVDIDPAIAKEMNLAINESMGFLVTDVTENGPADDAEIKGGNRTTQLDDQRDVKLGGDIITEIDGKPVSKIYDLLSYLEREKTVGDNVSLSLIRDGSTIAKTVVLGKRPGSDSIFQQSGNRQVSIGITGVNVTPIIAEAMNLTESRGFLVATVEANGPADKAGIQGGYKVETLNNTQYTLGGDVIIRIDNITVDTIENIKEYLDTKNEGDTVSLEVIRNGALENFDVKLELLEIPGNMTPFEEPNPFDRNEGQDPLEDLRDRCLERFSEIICNFLPP
jgi:S1-C subfamily serine protease